MHVTPKKTLFTLSHALVDLALLAPGRVTRKNYLNGGTLTLHDTWLGCVRGREEWTGETIFGIEARVHVPAHSLYVHGLSCASTVNLDPSHVSSACQAEENVVCNFKCWIHWGQLVYPVLLHQHREHCLEPRHLLVFLPLRISSRMSTTRPLIRSGKHSRISLSSFNRVKSPNWPTGSTLLRTTQTTCGWTASMPRKLARGLALELSSTSNPLSSDHSILIPEAIGTRL